MNPGCKCLHRRSGEKFVIPPMVRDNYTLKPMKTLFLPILALGLTIPLGAQEEQAENRRGVQVRGFAFSHFEGIEKVELRHEEKTVGELFLQTGQLRERSRVSSRIFSYGITRDGVFRSLGSTELPPEGKDFILVMAPVKNGYKAFPVRADDPEFRGDDTFLFNFTKYKIAVLLGDAKFKVEPWKNRLLRPSFAKDATFYQAMFAYEQEGDFIPFNNTRWPINPNTKALVFVYLDQNTNRLMYRAVTELAQAPSPTARPDIEIASSRQNRNPSAATVMQITTRNRPE